MTKTTATSKIRWHKHQIIRCGKRYFIEVPSFWSDTAAKILGEKYARKLNSNKYETSLKEMAERLIDSWVCWGLISRQLSKEEVKDFSETLFYHLVFQMASPNSPQWFNTGVYLKTKIKGAPQGHFYFNEKKKKVLESKNSFERPQPHACFIQSVDDQLLGDRGIMRLWEKEARLFKFGSGSGTNFSNLREKGAPLSTGGESAGVMAFLKVGDQAAGAIKSGGSNRRAAKMVVLDIDHPEIEEFILWKAFEEVKVQMLLSGQEEAQAHNPDLFSYIKKMDTSFEGEAYRTVSGQNSNNSISISKKFIKALNSKSRFSLLSRVDKKVVKKISAESLWHKISLAAWTCADPGLFFFDNINEWHTCQKDGNIRSSNPCAEYLFLDDTACNLASLNLANFLEISEKGAAPYFKLGEFISAIDVWIKVLDISVSMAQFPSSEMALRSYQYRTLGLGICNLGGFLMSQGIAYESEMGRSFAALIASLLTAQSYKSSALLALKLGPYPRFRENRQNHLRVLKNHYRSMGKLARKKLGDFEGLTVRPLDFNLTILPQVLVDYTHELWEEAILLATKFGLRNAQVTAIAPTGTIGLLMDCDVTGIEPDFSLVKFKTMVGAGNITIVNQSVSRGLKVLGYKDTQITEINNYILKKNTVVGAPYLAPKDYQVFDGAMAPENFPARAVSPDGHLLMVAAMQPFISGGISKTINLPKDTTVEEISEIYLKAFRMMIKCIAVYRNGCKLSQPLNVASNQQFLSGQNCLECSI